MPAREFFIERPAPPPCGRLLAAAAIHQDLKQCVISISIYSLCVSPRFAGTYIYIVDGTNKSNTRISDMKQYLARSSVGENLCTANTKFIAC